jgi:kynureninase
MTELEHDRDTDAAALDAADPLRGFREEFLMPRAPDGRAAVYFCGHSLGLQPRRTAALVNEELDAWAVHAVEGHFRGQRPWVAYHERLAPGLARLTGAEVGEVVAMNSLTVNLHLMCVSFYRPTSERYKLLIERPAFPSDRYAAESQVRFHGFDPADALLEVGARSGEEPIRLEDIARLIESEGSRIALVLLPGVQYLSGQLLEIEEITRLARRQGCQVGFDLAHAVGNVPLALHDWDVDFAVWCNYKYLNAGPGAIGGAFVHARHARAFDLPRFAGWWGHDPASRFRMGPQFVPIPGADGWQLSNPPILAMTPLIGSLELFDQAGIERLRRKSLALTGRFETLVRTRLDGRVSILTPTDPQRRGCQLSLRLHLPTAEARTVHEALVAGGYFCDWREPDVIRAAPVPLYNRFEDVDRFVSALERALDACR